VLRWLPLLSLTACGRFSFDASTDASLDAQRRADGASDGGGCTALFCDGFEDGMNAWTYTVVEFGTVDATTTRAYRGTHALEATTDGSTNLKYARWGKILSTTLTSGDLYVRPYMWLSASITDQLSVLVAGNGTEPFPSVYVLNRASDVLIHTDAMEFPFPQSVPQNRWLCMELHVVIDATAGSVDVAFDGIPTLQSGPANTTVAGGYTNVDVGIHYATPAQEAGSLSIDEVVVDTTPIGCN
jgi:hypothetical protein